MRYSCRFGSCMDSKGAAMASADPVGVNDDRAISFMKLFFNIGGFAFHWEGRNQ